MYLDKIDQEKLEQYFIKLVEQYRQKHIIDEDYMRIYYLLKSNKQE